MDTMYMINCGQLLDLTYSTMRTLCLVFSLANRCFCRVFLVEETLWTLYGLLQIVCGLDFFRNEDTMGFCGHPWGLFSSILDVFIFILLT